MKNPRRIGRLLPAATALALVLGVLALAAPTPVATAADEPSTLSNIALAASEHAPEVTVSYVPPWNSAAALNDGRTGPTDDLAAMWGTWGADPAPDADLATYTWDVPVALSGSTLYLWQNYGVQDGGVMIPDSWSLEYRTGAGEWAPVTGVADYPLPPFDPASPVTSLAPVFVSFDAVTTRALRVSLHRQEFGGIARATSVIEWEVAGVVAPSDPEPGDGDGYLAAENVAVRTVTGTAPILPSRVWIAEENRPLRDVEVAWDAVASTSYATGGTFTVDGTPAGYPDQPVAATVFVADRLSATITAVDYSAVVTAPGIAPVLPDRVRVRFDDDTAESAVPVMWAPVSPVQYAQPEAMFDVVGAVDGFSPGAIATVFVLAAVEDSAPLVSIDFDTAPEGSGWYVSAPLAAVTAQRTASDIAGVEISTDGGATWMPYTAPVAVTAQGTVSVLARATAVDGAVGSASATVRIDTRPPVTANRVDIVDGASATITLEPSDPEPGSGVSRTVWSDGPDKDPSGATNNMYATYEKPFSVVLTDQPRYVHVRSQDLAGNEESVVTITLPVRTAPPVASPTPVPPASPPAAPTSTVAPGVTSLPTTGGSFAGGALIGGLSLLATGVLVAFMVRRRRRSR